MNNFDYDIAIIGGGPAGSTAASFLAEAGFSVCLFEKQIFPRETLCGEFLSHEVIKIISELGLDEKFNSLSPNPINKLRIFNNSKDYIQSPLGFSGFGLKRSILDKMLLDRASELGAKILQPADVKKIIRSENHFEIIFSDGDEKLISSKKVIAAYGKRNSLDKFLFRDFAGIKTKLNGIKFHANLNHLPNFEKDEIQIYLTDGIYCGVNKVSESEAAVCFLADWNEKKYSALEFLKKLSNENIFFNNIIGADFWRGAEEKTFYGKANIYFGKKYLVEDGIFMIGDSARVIAPLAGDGIGMAMESGKLLAKILVVQKEKNLSSKLIEKMYIEGWEKLFLKRVRFAKIIQSVLLNSLYSKAIFKIIKYYPNGIKNLIKYTRGQK